MYKCYFGAKKKKKTQWMIKLEDFLKGVWQVCLLQYLKKTLIRLYMLWISKRNYKMQ